MPINKNLLHLSRQLRNTQTPWEKKLWMHLRGKRFYGHKFKRQAVIGKYIVDFSCHANKLIIELDGSGHAENLVHTKDLVKEQFLKEKGYKILRFWNNEIEKNIEGVLSIIKSTLQPFSPGKERCLVRRDREVEP